MLGPPKQKSLSFQLFLEKKLDSLDELFERDEEDVVVNCSGLGARELGTQPREPTNRMADIRDVTDGICKLRKTYKRK